MKLFTNFVFVILACFIIQGNINTVYAASYFEDNFNDLNQWSINPYLGNPSGNWIVENTRLKSSVVRGVSSFITPINRQNLSNFRVTLLSKNISGIDQIYQFRVSENNQNYYQVTYRYNDSSWPDNNNIILYKFIDGSYQELTRYTPSSSSDLNIEQGKTNKVKIEIINRTINIYLNDVLLINYFDGENNYLRNGWFRMMSWAGDNYRVSSTNYYDNLKITSIDEPVNYGSWEQEKTKKYLIIPGFGASWNTEAMVYDQTVPKDQWKMTPFVHNYDKLEEALRLNGLNKNEDYFVWNYDWRQDMRQTVNDLDQFINTTVGTSGSVNIIGHSMGGLVARVWMQENDDIEVDKVITLGSPHQGTVKAYQAWSGGVTGENNEVSAVALKLLTLLHSKLGKSEVETLRLFAPSLQQMTPTYDFLEKNDIVITSAEMAFPNNDLVDWNSQLPYTMDNLHTIAGMGINTKNRIKVGNRTPYDVVLNRWNDGHPVEYQETNQGDGTVIKSSGVFESRNISQYTINSNHGDMPTIGVNSVLATLNLATTLPQTLTPVSNPKIIFYLGSPARMVVNCQGDEFNSDELGFIVLDRDYELCRVEVIGTGDGTYHLLAGRTDEIDSFKYFEDLITNNEIKEISISFQKPMLDIRDSVDYIKSIALTDMEKLIAAHGINTTLLLSKEFLLGDEYEKAILSVYRFRRESGKWTETKPLLSNLILLLGTKNIDNNSSSGQRELMDGLADTIAVVETLKASNGNMPSINGSRSYSEFEEAVELAKKYVNEGNTAMAYANYLAARMYLYEVW